MTTTQLRTLDDYMTLDWPEDGRKLELVRGEVIEVPSPGTWHGYVQLKLIRLMANFAEEYRLGLVCGDNNSYVLARQPDTVRIPDASFIARDRVTLSFPPVWYFAPDLAVEVVSPSERRREIDAKVQDYLASGVRLVWVIWPDTQTVTVYTLDAEPHTLAADDALDGGDVLPGFAVSVAALFAVNL